MFISQSIVRKIVATLGAAVGFVFVYETTIRDSRYAARQATVAEAAPRPAVGTPLAFTATAYCKGETTASGVVVRTGIAAADPSLLPVGSVVRVEMPDPQYDGIWTIMDTGPSVQGRTLDLYMWSCHDALKFGRRSVRVDVLRLGWNPQNSEPVEVDALFRKREKTSIPAKPIEPTHLAGPPES
jgi:3D (Asp-Asp-Asp) domain-containing protein